VPVAVYDGAPGSGADGIRIDNFGASLTGTLNGYALTGFGISIDDLDGTAFSSSMLQIPTDLSQFESATVYMQFSGSAYVVGNITSIQLVPEPSLAALLGVGALAIALRRRA
jgi:hypothetical protein